MQLWINGVEKSDFGHSKADRKDSCGLAVDNFSVFKRQAIFFLE